MGTTSNKSFEAITNLRVGRLTVNYFEEAGAQSSYHYLLRSGVIQVICKGIRKINDFEPVKGVQVHELQELQAATTTGLIVTTAKRTGLSESQIVGYLSLAGYGQNQSGAFGWQVLHYRIICTGITR